MEHIWKIYNLKRNLSDGLVTEVTYGCESNYSGSGVRRIGDLEVSGSASDPGFIEYENLTEEIILTWVTGSIDTSSIETENSSSVAEQVARKAAITTGNGTPW